MSIAVAIKKGRTIALAADSQSNFGGMRFGPDNHAARKIRKIGSSLLATTGWGVYEDIFTNFLATRRRVPPLTSKATIFAFFLKLWDDLHDKYPFVNDQAHTDENSPFGDLDASFLIVSPSGIFNVSSDLSVTEFMKYDAIGSGSEFALGAVHARFDEKKLDASGLARLGVETGINFNVYCGGEIRVETIKTRK